MPQQEQNTKPEKEWPDRIVGYGRVKPDSLLFHPDAAYFHPLDQRTAVLNLLRYAGWAEPVIVNQATGYLLGGRLRVLLADYYGQESIPVVYVNIPDPDMERLIVVGLNATARKCLPDTDLPFIERTDEDGRVERVTTSTKSKMDEVVEYLITKSKSRMVKAITLGFVHSGILKIGERSRSRTAAKQANIEQLEIIKYQARNMDRVVHAVGTGTLRLYGSPEEIETFTRTYGIPSKRVA